MDGDATVYGTLREDMDGYEVKGLKALSIPNDAGDAIATLTPTVVKACKFGDALLLQGSFYLKGTQTGTAFAGALTDSPFKIKLPDDVFNSISANGSGLVAAEKAVSGLGSESLIIRFDGSESGFLKASLEVADAWDITSQIATYGTAFDWQLTLLLGQNLV